MKKILYFICAIILILLALAIFDIIRLKNIKYNQPELLSGKKILTVYFSNSGITKNIANSIHSTVGGDIEEIQLLEKYPNNPYEMSKTVRKQIKEGELPEIASINISDYDIIFVGSPVWLFNVSLPAKAFLKNNNFENKTIVPFFTCGAYANKNKLANEIETLAGSKDVKNLLLLHANELFLSEKRVINWLNRI